MNTVSKIVEAATCLCMAILVILASAGIVWIGIGFLDRISALLGGLP